jgi:agmatinase
MARDRHGFMEDKIESVAVERGSNRFVVSLLPYEETTTYKKGTRLGPEAIVEASGHVELLDETLRVDASAHGIATVRPRITDLESITAHAAELAAAHPDALLGFLGGEHAVTPAILAGLGRKDIGIVWLDAHADLRPSYCGREDNHACAGHNSLPFGRVVQVGIRSLADEEVETLESTDRVQCYRRWNDAARDAIRALPEIVYMSIDLDGLDPMLMRAVGTPEPGGLVWDEAVDFIEFVLREKNVFAFDVVELCPDEHDVVSSFTAARLVYKVMAYYAHYRLEGQVPPGEPRTGRGRRTPLI